MRGVFTAGVLDGMARDEEPPFDLVVGASAGACCAVSYLAGQHGRNRRIFLDHMATRAFANPWRMLWGGSLTDMDFLMGPVTLKLDPLDVGALRASPTRFETVTTHAHTGEPCYLPGQDDDCLVALHATVAIPFFYRGGPVRFRGEDHFDGGVVDPIPVKHALDMGATEVTVVLTRPPSWEPERFSPVARLVLAFDLRRFRGTYRALMSRHATYDATRRLLAAPPAGVLLRMISPPEGFMVKRFTMDRGLLEAGYETGLDAWGRASSGR